MPKLVVTNAKGLFQKTGTGGAVGLERVLYQKATIAAAAGNNITSFALPTNSLITEMGFAVTSKLQKTGAGTDLNIGLDIGTNANGAGGEICNGGNDVIVDGADSGLTAGTAFSLAINSGVAGAIPDATTDAVIVADAPLFSTTARTIYFNLIIHGTDMSQAGEVFKYIKYTTFNSDDSAGV